MPANLTPDYLAAEERFRKAKTDEERVQALEEMYSTIPKHKGTEKMRADIKRRISKLKKDDKKKGGAARHVYEYHVPKEGAAQISLVGFANAGKSSLIAAVTNAEVVIADYPGSTLKPVPGMMPIDDIQVQLVDLPPVDNENFATWISNILRYSDVLALVLDLVDEPGLQLQLIEEILNNWRITLLKKTDSLPEPQAGLWPKRPVLIGSKADLPGAAPALEELIKSYGESYHIAAVSAQAALHLDAMKKTVFDALDLVRVYSKVPGKDPDYHAPFILSKGATVLDMAEKVHKDIKATFKYARIWGADKYEGQKVSRDYILSDRDVIEIHT